MSLLLAASVQGPGFDSAILAEVLHADALQVEAQLRRLEDHHAIIKAIGERELPDEPSNLRYQFVHVLYQQELYARLGPTRRAALSRATAEALLKHHQQTVSSVAATAAVLFETAREHLRAAHYMLVAAQGTMRISPNRTTIDQAQRGLTLLSKVKAGPEELSLIHI